MLKVLVGGGADDRVHGVLFTEGAEGGVRIARIGEVAVDLIDDDAHMVAAADRAVLGELLPGPHAARGVLGRAEQAQLHIVFHDLPLDVIEIVHAVFLAPADERALHHAAARRLDGGGEALIHRRLDEHRVVRLGEGPHRSVQGRHDAGGLYEPVLLHFPAEILPEPVVDRLEIGIVRIGIAEDPVRHRFGERFRDARRGLEIHVGDPEGQRIRGIASGFIEIIFQGKCVFSVDYRIEIEHRRASFSAGHRPGREEHPEEWGFAEYAAGFRPYRYGRSGGV